MFLTVSSGTRPRFAITTSGNGAEQQLNAPAALPLNQWSHIAITHTGDTGRMYIDGALVAANDNMPLTPASLGATPNNFIGRSQFADPYLNASVDDFQIYSRGLSTGEVGAPGAGDVASYKFDEDSGATAADASGNHRDATIVSPVVNVITPQGLTGYWEAPYLFKRNGLYYLAYARGNPQTGGNPATIDYATATNPLGPWTYRGRILDTVTNTTTNHAAIVQFKGQWYAVYHNGALPGGGEFRRSVSVDKLYFNDDGTIQKVQQTLDPQFLRPTYSYDDLSFNGTDQFTALPPGAVWNMYDFTFAAWVYMTSSDPAQRIFDFGSTPNSHMYLTPQSRFAITKSALGAQLYLNGVQVGQNTNMSLYPARLGNAPNNWMGRSQNVADPYFSGEMKDVRIYQRGLGAAEVSQLATMSTSATGDVGATVPAQLALTLGASPSFGAFTPGVDKEYTATTTANVVSTAADATLSVSDPGHLTNGGFSLPEPLRVEPAPASWTGPVANATSTITFRQHIGTTDALRTGSYSRPLTFTLSTTSP